MRITGMLSSLKVEAEVTKGTQVTMVDLELVESPRGKGESSGQKNDDNTTAMVQNNDNVVLLINEEEECMHLAGVESEWVVDTAASYHATPIRDLFCRYVAGDFGNVKMGNTSYSKIEGIGDVCIKTNVGCTLVLKDVRHIPDLRMNLISGVALDRDGYENYFANQKWRLTKGELVIAKRVARGTLYRTNAEICQSELNAAHKEISADLWHRRMGHMSEKGLKILSKKSLISVDKERETGRKLKRLRTDNGGEYTSREFEEYCSNHGIRHEKTVPGTPQHNGVAERMNRTMLKSPSVPLEFDIPERVWTNKEMSYSHLKVFGCKAFVHVPKEQRTKLDDKSVPCIFIGYEDEEFGYRLWDPVKKNVIRSRYVIFRESEVGTVDALSEMAKEKNGIVPNLVTIPSTSSHPISAESTIDEVAEQEEQPNKIVE
ncbi:hypothetical protein KY284_005590 [Solanum tuberosum]|nr:hypothetical protein KY284_005590 [Solanum tuberosum]